MAHIMKLKDGSKATIFNIKDFEYLIGLHMGQEALDYFQSYREEVMDALKIVSEITPDEYVLELIEDFANGIK